MQVNTSDQHVVLQPAARIRLSRPGSAFAALALILLVVAPIKPLVARDWDIGGDVYIGTTKSIVFTADPEIFNVELPAGQSQITKAFGIEMPGPEIQDQLPDYYNGSPKLTPAVSDWLLDVSKLPLLFQTEVHVSAEGDDRLFEVLIAVVYKDAYEILWATESKMYVTKAPENGDTYVDVSVKDFDREFVNTYVTRTAQRTNYGLRLEITNQNPKEQDPLTLLVTLREVPLSCWMQVDYWGDVEGIGSGDLAYYNNFLKEGGLYAEQGGVYRATGNAADPTAQPMIDQFLPILGSPEKTSVFSEEEVGAMSGSAFDPFTGYVNPELEALVEENNEKQQQQQEESAFAYWVGGKGQVPDDELETFGLSLVGRNISQTSDKATDKASGLEQLATASVLLAATRAHLSWMPVMPDRETWNEDVPLSRLEFRPIAMGALFRWEEGKPGSGTLRLSSLKNGVLYGRITGTLYSREMRRPDDSSSEISIRADFIAAEGAFTCDLPAPTKILK